MYITAERIHDGRGWMQPGTVIEVSEEGIVLSIVRGPHPNAVFYTGVLCPGFVNVHCHLELSHMKGLVPEHTGLIPFLKNIPLHRNDFTEEQKNAARHEAYDELLRNGVVAVGDIANTADTMDVRAREGLDMHTFVEALGFNDERAPLAFDYALQTYNRFAAQYSNFKELRQSIVPHAPYSVSPTLFRLIDVHKEDSIVSIHNQESPEEDIYFKTKTGAVSDLLHTLGIDDSLFAQSGKSSLQTYLEHFSPSHAVVLVHNTYTPREDVRFAINALDNVHWCLCPNANLYIENKLPDVDMLLAEGAHICIGTDSLASNHQLCILSELYAVKKRYPHYDWGMLLSWATFNGARALQMQMKLGLIAPGKAPGIIQINGLDKEAVKPSVKRIV